MLRFVGTCFGSSRFREASRKLAPFAAPPLPVKAKALTGALSLTIYLHYALWKAPRLTQFHLAYLCLLFIGYSYCGQAFAFVELYLARKDKLGYTEGRKTDKEGLRMELLEERIRREGTIRPGGVLKVDKFLNHQIDSGLLFEMAKEFKRLFGDQQVNKILTIEASGIAMASMTAYLFSCPLVFAKKSKSRNISDDVYSVEIESFTHGNTNTVVVSREYLGPQDRVLIIDDFLATGAALAGLVNLVDQAGGTVVGAGIAIEKAFQPGGAALREMGVRVESLARIRTMEPMTFVE